jgi:hypothetical protein
MKIVRTVATSDCREPESTNEWTQFSFASPRALGKNNHVAALADHSSRLLDHAQRGKAGNICGLPGWDGKQRMFPRVCSNQAGRMRKILKKQKRVKDGGMVRTKQGSTSVGGVFKPLIFAADAAHPHQLVEVSCAVAADDFPRPEVGCFVFAGGESKKNGGRQPSRTRQIERVGGV